MRDFQNQYQNSVRVHYTAENAVEILSKSLKERIPENTIVLCIGTDRCIGDTLGPLVGTLLKEKNFRFPLYGTLDEPIHAVNLEESMKTIRAHHPNGFFIAVDACLGDESLIGNIHLKRGHIYPGKGVGKRLPGVGNFSIVGIVDKINNEDSFSIHTIRLSLIMNMARTIADGLMLATYLS